MRVASCAVQDQTGRTRQPGLPAYKRRGYHRRGIQDLQDQRALQKLRDQGPGRQSADLCAGADHASLQSHR